MRLLATHIVPLLILSLSVGRLESQVLHPAYSGTAVDLATEQAVYTEDHWEIIAGDRRVGMTSEYRAMDGRLIARRTVDFRKDPFVPEFRFMDERDGYTEGAEIVGDSVRLFNRKSADDPFVETTLFIPPVAVVDAGFNNYVQDRWDAIARGEKQYFNFGTPYAQEYYGFRVYKQSDEVQGGRRLMVVHLDIDNFFIRLFLNPIVLKYDMQARRLVSYEGISNVNDERGKSYVVRITYEPYGP